MVNIFSDVHLGISRKAHTTAQSSDLWNEMIYQSAINALSNGTNIIVGDLFDKTFNHEKYLLQGVEIAKRALVLSGNHDETNRADTVSSLRLLSNFIGGIIRHKEFNEVNFYTVDNSLVFVPHCATQEQFVKCLEKAISEAPDNSYLFVHCNRGVIMEGTQADSTLFIDEEMEQRLTAKFRTLFYGHEHKPFHSDKVVVLGNTFPTSFSDISDKYSCQLNVDTGEKTYTKIFDTEKHYLKVDVSEVGKVNEDTYFLELTGEYPSRQVNEIIMELRYKYPDLLAVRSLCTYTDKVNSEVVEIDLQSIENVIAEELKGSELEPLYNELRNDL